MNITAICALFLSILTSAPKAPNVDLRQTLLKVSNATFIAFQKKDGVAMQSLTAPDFLYVGKEGILTLEGLGAATQGCTLRTFTLSSPQARSLSEDTAILVYRAEQDEVCEGKPQPSVLLSSDTFALIGGKWIITMHTETAPGS